MNNEKIKKIFTVLIVLLPFLYQYKSPISVISFGEFLLIPFIVYFTIKNFKTKVKYNEFNGLYIYLVCAVFFNFLASLQSYYSYGNFVTIFARIIYYALLIYVAYFNFDLKLGIKVVINASIFFSIYAIIQYSTYQLSGKVLPTIINPNWAFSREESGNRLNYEAYYRWLYRASSLFLEPGYFVNFCAPALVALLHFEENNKKNMIYACIITLAFVVSTSSASIVVLAFSWGAFVIKSVMTKKMKAKTLVFILLLMVFIMVLFMSPLAETLLKRTASGGSFNNRITRTFILFQQTNFVQKIVGVGINNVDMFVIDRQAYTMYDEKDLNFISSYLGTILSSGIITFIFYNKFFIVTFFKNKSNFVKVLTLIFLFYNFIGNIVYSNRFAYFTIFILCAQKYYKSINGGTNATD